MKINGAFVEGIGGATRNVAYQLPFFEAAGLQNTAALQSGTLNVDISPLAWEPHEFDYYFEDIPNGNDELETFGFVVINSLTHKDRVYDKPGYIYVPHSSPHFGNKQQLEVIAVPLEAKNNGDKVQLSVYAGNVVLKI